MHATVRTNVEGVAVPPVRPAGRAVDDVPIFEEVVDMDAMTDVLLERGPEVSELTSSLRRGMAGSGQTVLLEGPSGIGKSRLLAEAEQIARSAGADVLTTSGGE